MGTSYYLPRIKQHKSTKTTSSAIIRVVWMVLAGVVVQLSHAQAEMATTKSDNNSSSTMTTTTMVPDADADVVASLAAIKGEFSSLDKEVVERLIKEWAPVVWLAPEEKFMPLGVEEFLRNVHAVDKSDSEAAVKGMPLGENSKKSYLVTNDEIDELLEDNDSFLYGKNPNQHHVPIYAVVRLCSVPVEPTTTTVKPPTTPPTFPPMPQRRVPYIPVSMDESGEASNNVRRSSRLYPGFTRSRRNVPTYYDPNGTIQNPSAEPQIPKTPKPLPSTESDPSLSTEKEVSEFIANLADNVKFTGDNGMNNNINEDYIKPQKKMQHVPAFHVTYWMFYPYSQGKTMCTLSLGPLGSIPFPAVYGYCLGNRKDIGSHVGDWEHMSLYFDGTSTHPEAMYVSAHDAGAYYSYNHLTGSFEFKKQETRKGILQRPNFPKTVTTFSNHPVLFAAKGSHGLWTAPGKHRFVKVARLYDVNGFGTPWHTWKAVDVSYENLRAARSYVPTWLFFKGKWGNPKSKCHPLRRIGLNFCEYTDGPTGIPLKEPHFQCDAPTVL